MEPSIAPAPVPPPVPSVKPLIAKPVSAFGGNGSTKPMVEVLASAQLKKTSGPVVRGLGLKVVNVLLITNFWGCYNWLSEGIKLVLITSKQAEHARLEFIADPNNPRATACKTAFTEVVVVDNYFNGGEVECLAFQLHSKYNFTHVIVHTENDLIRAARIRSHLNIRTGQSLKNALRDKVEMKKVCVSKGVKVPEFASVESASDVLSFVKKHGFPVVVKPRMGYSSVDTTILRNMDDAETFCKRGLMSPGIDPILGLEVEKFVSGPMYHIDGFVYDGKVVISWPSEYMGTVVKFKTNPFIAGFSLSPDNPLVARLNSFVEQVIEALGSDPAPNPLHFPFHAEAWHTPEDEIVLCEIASRGGGGNIKKEFVELFHHNLDEIWTCAECGDLLPSQFENDLEKFTSWRTWKPKVDYLVGWSYIYPKKGTVSKFPQQDPVTKEWNPPLPDYCISLNTWLKVGQSFEGPRDCADTCCASLVHGKNEKEVVKNLTKICDWFWNNTVWEQA